VPADEAATRIGKANRRTDTKPEVRLRAALHRRGLRFRKDFRIEAGEINARVDIVFSRAKVAVFVDGCFWHGCLDHQRIPLRNQQYWIPKLATNTERDRRVDEALAEAGWHVERVWEHEDPVIAAHSIEGLVRQQSVGRND
jgi:DNA mismatch endonuclease (patch repair protein)